MCTHCLCFLFLTYCSLTRMCVNSRGRHTWCYYHYYFHYLLNTHIKYSSHGTEMSFGLISERITLKCIHLRTWAHAHTHSLPIACSLTWLAASRCSQRFLSNFIKYDVMLSIYPIHKEICICKLSSGLLLRVCACACHVLDWHYYRFYHYYMRTIIHICERDRTMLRCVIYVLEFEKKSECVSSGAESAQWMNKNIPYMNMYVWTTKK